jgi:glyoxylase-like metal-dependent hydrolase (beta-lactamase superfamily II)
LTHTFRDGRGLPAGVRSYPLTGLGPDEVAFFLPEHRTLVVADALLGAGGGVLRLAPRSWAGLDEAGRAAYDAWFRSEIRGLLDLPVDMVLVSHGEPALANGRRAIVDALASPAWGE